MTEPTNWADLECFAFGDSPSRRTNSRDLVLSGLKRATCWPSIEGQKTHIGKMMVMLNGSGTPAAALETVELKTRRFGEADEAFAFDEGEVTEPFDTGERPITRYFTRQGTFSPDMLLWCERFRVVTRLLHSRNNDPSLIEPIAGVG